MLEIGVSPAQLADRLEGKIHRSHVYDYLGRKKSMGSHKLSHLVEALGLELSPTKRRK